MTSTLYFFWAEDPFSLDQSLKLLRADLAKKYPGYEEIHWNPEQKNRGQLLEELGSFSFFSTHKLIRVEGEDYLGEENLNKISQALQNNSLATLIFITKKKIAFNQASKCLKGKATFIECVKPKPKDLASFVVSFAQEEGKRMSPLLARKLIEFVGDDLLGLQNQVKLLSTYVGKKNEIELGDIETLFAESADKDIFALTQLILQNEKAKTFCLLRQLLNQGEVPLIIFSLLARHYRGLLKIKLLERRKLASFEIAQHLKLPAFVIEKNIPQARQISWKKLIQIYQDLSKTDLALKSSPLPHLANLEKFVWGCF